MSNYVIQIEDFSTRFRETTARVPVSVVVTLEDEIVVEVSGGSLSDALQCAARHIVRDHVLRDMT